MNALIPQMEALARAVVAILLNSVWEDALLVFAVWLLLRSLRNTNASTRYFSWLVTLFAAVLLPIVTTLPQIRLLEAPTTVPVAQVHRSAAVLRPSVRSSTATLPAAANAAPRFRAPERLQLRVPAWLASVLFGAWIVAALVIAVRLAVDLFKLEALKRDSLPLPVEYRDQMERWVKAAYGNARDVRLCVSDRIEVPVAVGLFDSMILLPKHLLAELDAGELDRISLHELAHLHRSDDWTNSVQRFAQVLMFFNPAIRFIGSQLDLEREVACDDWVLELTGEVRPYATCLTKMAELTAWPHRALAAPGVFVTRKGISIRIERLLNKHRNARVKIAYGVPSVVAGALVMLFAMATFVTPVIAYTTESASSTVASVSQNVVSLTTHIRQKQVPAVPPAPVAAKRAVLPNPAPPVRTVTKTMYLPELKTTVKMHKTLVKIPAVHPAVPLGPMGAVPPGHDINVHVPASNVHVPEMNIHVPGREVRVPEINVHIPAAALARVRLPRGPMQISGLAASDFTCVGCNFERVDWAGKDMSNRSFTGSNFGNANLQGTNFSGSNLSGVNFGHANLRNANFTNAHMSGCNLEGADIAGARFDGAQISGCNGVNVRSLDQSQLHAWLGHCGGCNFENADLHNMDLRGIHMSGINLRHANLRGADLSGSSFSGVDLSGADLSGAHATNTHFSGCEFNRTDLRNLDLSTASFSGSDMSGAIMR